MSFERGVEASRAQRWDEARTQFRRSLELVPKASTMFNLAVADLKLGLGGEALEQLDAFEKAASPSEHAQMLERAQVLRPQAQALVDSAQAKAEHGGNVLSKADDGFSDDVRREVELARENYARGRDKEALAGFERAYKASRRGELLYNIGVVADRLRDDRRAARAYDQFVAALPDAPEAAVAQVRSDSLHAAMAAREQAGEEAARNNAIYTRSDRTPLPSLVAPRTLLVVGSLVTVASAIVLGTQVAKKHKYDECFDGTRDCNNLPALRGDLPLVKTGIGVSAATLAAGVVLTLTGAIVLPRRKRQIERAFGGFTPQLAASPDGASFGLSGRF